MVDGRIAERGTFEEMIENRGEFSHTFVTKGKKTPKGTKGWRQWTSKMLTLMRILRNDELRGAGRRLCK
jgi:hypothetical protein